MNVTTAAVPKGSSEPMGMNRLPGLDLMRALAIALVLISHFGPAIAWVEKFELPDAVAAAGLFGVELFFALSGFLIGGILIKSFDKWPSLSSWGVFILRRWMRTLPLYFAWIVVLTLAGPPAGGLKTIFAFTILAPNLAWPMMGGTWFPVAWSLMIEEWFYLLFSALLLVLAMRWRAHAMPIAIIIFILSPIWAALWFWGSGTAPDGNWDETTRKVVVVRLDAIAYGVFIAWLNIFNPKFVKVFRWYMFAAGLLLIGLAWLPSFGVFAVPQWALKTFYLPIISIGSAFFLPVARYAAMRKSYMVKAATWVSERAYGLYIVHFSLIHYFGSFFYARGWSLTAAVACSFAATFIIAEFSWRWFEKPILSVRPAQI